MTLRSCLTLFLHRNHDPWISNQNNNTPEISENPISVIRFGEFEYDKEQFLKLQTEDEFCNKIKRQIANKAKNTVNRFEIIDDLMYNTKLSRKRLVIPMVVASEFISFIHVAMGHNGAKSLQKLVDKNCFINKIQELCQSTAQKCIHCIQCKPRSAIKPSLIEKKVFADQPFLLALTWTFMI